MLNLVLLAAATAAAPNVPSGPALSDALAARDAEFFQLFFEGCDPARLSTMLTADFEFYHDKDGLVASSAASFVDGYRKTCEGRKIPDAWRSRRQLVAGSMTAHRMANYGAVEIGEHVFYERKGDGPERLVGKAHFTQLWKLDADGWKLARVLSYDHEAVK